jgi:hypothetical protein
MVERGRSFGDDDEIDDEQTQKVANTTTGDDDDGGESPDRTRMAARSVASSSGVTGKYDDAPDDYCIRSSGSGLSYSGDPSLATTTATSSAPELTISSMTEETSVATARSPPPPPPSLLIMTNPPAASNNVWSDAEAERIVMDLLLSNGTATTGNGPPPSPPNVLDLRRSWTREPVPDTRQLNRVLYQLCDKGEIEQLPPNGKNQKPCWKASNIVTS